MMMLDSCGPLAQYAVLLARGTRVYHKDTLDMAVPLGHHHHRGVVLPFAVTARGGPVRFHVSHVAGCSSTLEMNRSTTWGKFCLGQLETRTVPSLSLTSALGLAGSLPIGLLKLDAQGADLTLLMSVPPGMLRERVKRIIMEVVADDCNPLYVGQPLCSMVLQSMRALGYAAVYRGKPFNGESCTEGAFVRIRPWLSQPHSEGRRFCEIDPTFYRTASHLASKRS